MASPGVERRYAEARERYAAELGVDTEAALAALSSLPLSIHCWQGDDVGGFERAGSKLDGGGLAVTGNHPGRARNPDELRADLDRALSLIPGVHRVNLHAMYGEFGEAPASAGAPDRDAMEPGHFSRWISWAKSRKIGLDFNATCFSHPKAADGWTLSHADPAIRGFWVEHVRRCREIGARMGQDLGTPCVHNLWIPDGSKDHPTDRSRRRHLLRESLDAVYSARHDAAALKDAIEGKLFGIGSEAFVAGSHEFYLAYAVRNGLMPCLDLGHYHPTESVADKISAILEFCPEVLLHLSRGVRWDSDHVVVLNDEVSAVAAEVIRAGAAGRVYLGLDYFDASLNRVGAWVTGARAVLSAFLLALLEPLEGVRQCEAAGDMFGRLGLLEQAKQMPWGAVWDRFCESSGVPAGQDWIAAIREYERTVQSRRG